MKTQLLTLTCRFHRDLSVQSWISRLPFSPGLSLPLPFSFPLFTTPPFLCSPNTPNCFLPKIWHRFIALLIHFFPQCLMVDFCHSNLSLNITCSESLSLTRQFNTAPKTCSGTHPCLSLLIGLYWQFSETFLVHFPTSFQCRSFMRVGNLPELLIAISSALRTVPSTPSILNQI